MIRKIIKPKNNQIVLNIPESYIDKEIELIIFPRDKEESYNLKKNKSLKGVFNKYADNSKIPLEEKAWQKHIIDSFNND